MIEAIDPAALPAIALRERDTLPRISAVYFAMSDKGEILYIGGTKSLRLRWLNNAHHKLSRLQAAGCVKIAWTVCAPEEIESLEAAARFRFKPPLNATWSLMPRPPRDVRMAIERCCQKRPAALSMNAWITEAILKKLEAAERR